MKKTILLTILVSSFYFITCCNSNNGKNVKYTTGEDTIDLTNDTVSRTTGDSDETNANQDLFINGDSIGFSFTINKPNINILENKANQLSSGLTGGFITVLQIFYGIDTGRTPFKLELFLRPLCLKDTSIQQGKIDTFIATSTSLSASNQYYVLTSSGAFIPDTHNKYGTDVPNYQKYIEIRHHPCPYPKPTKPNFNPAQNDTGDVTSIIFPFQEIDAAMNANIMQNNKPDTIINLHNIGYPYHKTTQLVFIKHDILLAPPPMRIMAKPTWKFPPKEFADLANMCPPECPQAGVTYTLLLKNKKQSK